MQSLFQIHFLHSILTTLTSSLMENKLTRKWQKWLIEYHLILITALYLPQCWHSQLFYISSSTSLAYWHKSLVIWKFRKYYNIICGSKLCNFLFVTLSTQLFSLSSCPSLSSPLKLISTAETKALHNPASLNFDLTCNFNLFFSISSYFTRSLSL